MAQKRTTVIHSTPGDYNYVSPYDILSQTPENYSKDNYFLKELQDKINQDWVYRPNRALIQYETVWGAQSYADIDVVLQSVISEKGTPISDDTRNIVFKNISEDRFQIGSRFKFALDLANASSSKDTWLAVNQSHSKFTASVVTQRCNGTLCSTYIENGVSKIHVEPVVQGADLSSVSFRYHKTVTEQQSHLEIIAQHNQFTKEYFVNERFIVGYDKVYRILAIDKFYGNSTDDPQNVGVMKIYLEIDEKSEYDNFDTRIAYQNNEVVIPETTKGEEKYDSYFVKFTSPNPVPTQLTSELVTFVPVVCSSDGTEYTSQAVTTTVTLENLASGSSLSRYVTFTPSTTDSSFTLKRNRPYLKGNLIISCTATIPTTNESFTTEFIIGVNAAE